MQPMFEEEKDKKTEYKRIYDEKVSRGAEEDSRAEHRAVVVDEVGGDELMSGLCGAKAELHHPLLS